MSISSCFSDFKLISVEHIWQQHRALNNLYAAGESWNEQFTGGENESWDPKTWLGDLGSSSLLLRCRNLIGDTALPYSPPNSFEKTPPVSQIIASPIQVFSALSIFFFIFSHTTHQLLIQRFVHLTILQWCCIAKDTLEVYLTEVKNLTLKMLDQMAK